MESAHLFQPPFVPYPESNDGPDDRLKSLFLSAWPEKSSAESVWSVLKAQYSESGRHFHTLQHIAECLEIARRYARRVSWPELPVELSLAIWFHDVVYEPGARNNEQRSVELFQKLAKRASLPAETVQGVSALVLETRDHSGRGVILSGVMCDCDLSILGSSPERYREYSGQVRREHEQLTDWRYKWGRSRFLKGMLQKKRIFTTPLFDEAFGEAARRNLSCELKALTSRRSLCLAG